MFWFTGLSGSGKTTIVNAAVERLVKQNRKIKIFDGDVVRQELNRHLSFSPEDIRENNRIIADLCLGHRGEYDHIFVPIISPFEESRAHARRIIGSKFYLVYIKASLDEVIKRDVKGMYKKALRGDIKNFIGIDKNVPFEEPKNADLVLNSENEDVSTSVKRLLNFVGQKCT